jgi:hypothetical protein
MIQFNEIFHKREKKQSHLEMKMKYIEKRENVKK